MVWSIVAGLSVVELLALALSAAVSVAVLRRFIYHRVDKNDHHLPPGPTPFPLVGSALSVNAKQPWLTYTEWGEKYGNVVYARLLNMDVIVLQTYSDAMELLEKRSQLYSDRPFLATTRPFALAAYGPNWRLSRRIFHQTFRAGAAVAFRPMQLRRARQVVISIIDNPREYQSYYSTFSAAVAMSAVYDYEPQPREDPMVKLTEAFCKASIPSLTIEKSILIKMFPFLLSVPEWVPVLSRIRREASIAYELSIKAIETPFQWVRKRMEANEDVTPETMVFDHIQRMQKLDDPNRTEYETALKSASMSALLGATETTSGLLMSFTLAMVQNPRVWKRAQAEIDAMIGTVRLPEYADRPSLPYVDAIVRETLRWKPIVSMGMPHRVIADDHYKGYYIPSGTVVFANVWGMTRDETRYPNAEIFTPERFLDSNGMLTKDDPGDFVFGFGRRICPGRHAGDASLWGAVATMLATLDFHAVKDADGNDIVFEAKFNFGATHHPTRFPCNLTPRAHITREALQRSLEN